MHKRRASALETPTLYRMSKEELFRYERSRFDAMINLTSLKEGLNTMDKDKDELDEDEDEDIPAVLDPAKVYSSLSEYCAEKRISPATYYRRVKAGKGPRTVKIGVMRAILRDQPKAA